MKKKVKQMECNSPTLVHDPGIFSALYSMFLNAYYEILCESTLNYMKLSHMDSYLLNKEIIWHYRLFESEIGSLRGLIFRNRFDIWNLHNF